jgi:hypothetical protein
LVLNEQEAGWAPEPAWLLWRRKKAVAHGGNLSLFHWFFSPWSAHYTDYAFPNIHSSFEKKVFATADYLYVTSVHRLHQANYDRILTILMVVPLYGDRYNIFNSETGKVRLGTRLHN